jgi:hypothetical protein
VRIKIHHSIIVKTGDKKELLKNLRILIKKDRLRTQLFGGVLLSYFYIVSRQEETRFTRFKMVPPSLIT